VRRTASVLVLTAALTMSSFAAGSSAPAATTSTLLQHYGSAAPAMVQRSLAGMKVINYYPARHAWSRMWLDWTPKDIDADFARIAALGDNVVRVFVQPGAIGYPAPTATMLKRVRAVLYMANAHHLRVQLSLFDSWVQYGDIAGSQDWAHALLGPLKGDPRIALVELQNEIDPTDSSAMAWARTMLPYLRDLVTVPLLVSPATSPTGSLTPFGRLRRALGAAQPDVYSYHYYGDITKAVSELTDAMAIASPAALVVGETGYPTGTSATSPVDPAKEKVQLQWYGTIERATTTLGLPPAAPWVFQDFAAGQVSSGTGHAYRMGLLRLDGSAKPAYNMLKQFYSMYDALLAGAIAPKIRSAGSPVVSVSRFFR